MGKLHELLAVETDLEGTYKKMVEEAINTFTKKPEHFMGSCRVLEMFDSEKEKENTTEYKELVTTVDAKLQYVEDHIVRYIDAVYQKEDANQRACADLVIDGVVVAENVPATFLLGLENKFKTIRQIFESVPTLMPGVSWKKDESAGEGVYKTEHPDVKFKTAKTIIHKVLVQPTDKHPAQIDKWEEQVPVGKYTTTGTSGMITPARKSQMLAKVDSVIRGCKQARQRANCVEVLSDKVIGKTLFDIILT